MDKPEIAFLYKFYSVKDHSLSVLANRKVWFSKPASLNDPFDMAIAPADEISSEDFISAINNHKSRPDISQEELTQISEILEWERNSPNPHFCSEAVALSNRKFCEDRKNWGVFCLTEKNDDIMMWSHYADRHRGFCVQFERTPENDLGKFAYRLTYSKNYPSTYFFDTAVFNSLLLTKFHAWQYEEEWRMISEEGNKEADLPGGITGIIFGIYMSENNKNIIRKILSNDMKVKFYQANKVEKHFKIEIKRL